MRCDILSVDLASLAADKEVDEATTTRQTIYTCPFHGVHLFISDGPEECTAVRPSLGYGGGFLFLDPLLFGFHCSILLLLVVTSSKWLCFFFHPFYCNFGVGIVIGAEKDNER